MLAKINYKSFSFFSAFCLTTAPAASFGPQQQYQCLPSHRISVTQLNSRTIYTQFYYIQRKMRNILTPVTMFFQHVSLSSSNTMACDIIFFHVILYIFNIFSSYFHLDSFLIVSIFHFFAFTSCIGDCINAGD